MSAGRHDCEVDQIVRQVDQQKMIALVENLPTREPRRRVKAVRRKTAKPPAPAEVFRLRIQTATKSST